MRVVGENFWDLLHGPAFETGVPALELSLNTLGVRN